MAFAIVDIVVDVQNKSYKFFAKHKSCNVMKGGREKGRKRRVVVVNNNNVYVPSKLYCLMLRELSRNSSKWNLILGSLMRKLVLTKLRLL